MEVVAMEMAAEVSHVVAMLSPPTPWMLAAVLAKVVKAPYSLTLQASLSWLLGQERTGEMSPGMWTF